MAEPPDYCSQYFAAKLPCCAKRSDSLKVLQWKSGGRRARCCLQGLAVAESTADFSCSYGWTFSALDSGLNTKLRALKQQLVLWLPLRPAWFCRRPTSFLHSWPDSCGTKSSIIWQEARSTWMGSFHLRVFFLQNDYFGLWMQRGDSAEDLPRLVIQKCNQSFWQRLCCLWEESSRLLPCSISLCGDFVARGSSMLLLLHFNHHCWQ